MIGGDKRDLFLARNLLDLGIKLKTFGLPESSIILERIQCKVIEEVIGKANVIIFPITGVDTEGNLRTTQIPVKLTKDLLAKISKDTLIIVGSFKKKTRDLCDKLALKYVEYLDRDEVAILNSIPSAEGAIGIAIEETDITIHGSSVYVLGFGRTGKTVARMCAGIGAFVSVAARKPRDIARIQEMGYEAVEFKKMSESIAKADIIFNTVPVLVLTKKVLENLKRDAFILDLASPPGGVDYETADKLGIKAILAPGLPGKVAPKTAGEILASVIPKLIIENL